METLDTCIVVGVVGESPKIEYSSAIIHFYMCNTTGVELDHSCQIVNDITGETIYGIYSSWEAGMKRVQEITGKPYNWGF